MAALPCRDVGWIGGCDIDVWSASEALLQLPSLLCTSACKNMITYLYNENEKIELKRV